MSWKSMARSSIRPVALVLVGGLLAGGQALAADESDARTMSVTYRDLNLSTLAGANSLYQRIRGAARVVCSQPEYGLRSQRLYKDCYTDAISGAVAAVNNPNLTAVYHGQINATAMLTRPALRM
jgi:UrcA family protein